MSNQLALVQFRSQLSESILTGQFIKASLGNYQGNIQDLKNLYVRKVVIKRAPMLSFTYRYKTRDIFKNFSLEEGIDLVMNFLSNDFRICTLFTSDREVIVEHGKSSLITLRERKLITSKEVSLDHNKEKKRLIQSQGKPYLVDLRLTDDAGNVFKAAQDKYRQINKYIEILSSLVAALPEGSVKSVVDMGSGKGYLTFALYDYLQEALKLEAKVTGIEYREDLVILCNDIAKRSAFIGLEFVQGTIENYKLEQVDLLIALHACGTATDDAIIKGIHADAKLIVVAPCCHKQIRKEMVRGKVKNDISFLTKHGIFMERQAEMVTDGIRALVLEYYGYKTKVFEFISDVHTPKNVLIVGTKTTISEQRKLDILNQIQEVKAYFGIESHYLEKIFMKHL